MSYKLVLTEEAYSIHEEIITVEIVSEKSYYGDK